MNHLSRINFTSANSKARLSRLLSALEAQPMNAKEMAGCMFSSVITARLYAQKLREEGVIHPIGKDKTGKGSRGRAPVYALREVA